MKKYLILTLIILTSISSFGQSLKLEWALGIREPVGTNYLDGAEILSIDIDSSGNVYSTGWLSGNTEFTPFTTPLIPTTIEKSVFVLKQNSNGSVIWIKLFSANSYGDSKGTSVVVDENGDIVVVGQFWGTLDFDPTAGINNITSTGSSDLFVLKIDGSGNLIWVETIGGSNRQEGVAVTTDNVNNIYIAGDYVGLTDFDPGSGIYNIMSESPYYRDVFALKLNANGAFIWVKSVGAGSDEYANNIDLDSNNNVFFGGRFSGSGDFNPGLGVTTLSAGSNFQAFFVKLDSSGNYIWAKSTQIVSPSYSGFSICKDFKVTPNGDIYFTGVYSDYVDFNPSSNTDIRSTPNVSSRSGYIAKWTSSGSFSFVRTFTGNYNSFETYGLDLDTASNIFITGHFSNTVDFSPGAGSYVVTSSSSEDVFMIKLDPTGSRLLSRTFGKTLSSEKNRGNCITLDNNQNIYMGGYYKDTLDINPSYIIYNLINTPTNLNNTWSGFCAKFSSCIPSTSVMNVNGCGSYIAPSGSVITGTGVYQDIIVNSIGCDSIITINYTNSNSISLVTVDRCSGYTVPSGGATYTASGTYTVYDTLPNAFGCDSIMNILLSINDNHYSSLVFACDSFMMPSMTQVYYTSGIYYDTIPNMSGCRDFFADTVVVYNTTYGINTMSGCGSVTSLSGNQFWTSSGTYLDTIGNPLQAYCDSIITTTVTIYNESLNTIYPTACYSYLAPNGATYYNSGTYINTFTNAIGCDSNLIINLTILQSSAGGVKSIWVACPPYNSQTGNQVWTVSGTYMDTLYNANSVGCDSTYTVSLTIPISTIPVIQEYTCDTFVSYSGNQAWTNSGVYRDTLSIINQYGCDSIVDVQLTIGNTTRFITTSTCSPVFTSPSGKIWTASGLYYDTIPNTAGCDSLMSYYISIDISKAAIVQSNDTLFAVASNWLFGIPTGLIKFQWFSCNGSSSFPLTNLDANNLFYVINTSGNYKLRLNAQQHQFLTCEDTTSCIPYFMVGINDFKNGYNINVYPNPNTGVFVIEKPVGLNEQVGFKLMDITSRIIKSGVIPPGQQKLEMDIINYSKGVYYLQLIVNEEVFVKQILKN